MVVKNQIKGKLRQRFDRRLNDRTETTHKRRSVHLILSPVVDSSDALAAPRPISIHNGLKSGLNEP